MSYSVTQPSARQKWIAGILVIGYALITMLPLLWIIATGFKSSADSIAYPPKILFEPTVEGYVNVFTTQTRLSSELADVRDAEQCFSAGIHEYVSNSTDVRVVFNPLFHP